ncbi:MAG: ATP-dependent Clp protease ATP-binding subunit, partial [Myxococcales bacterium]|nr:ATP-dependent Clp protease ATP-binding subunit [Myxococcales bacterium]
ADIDKAVREFFPPELFNRIDRVVPFSSLEPLTARRVADKELTRLLSRRGLTERRVFVRATARVLDQVVARGFDPEHGARTVKRYLEDHVGSLLTDVLTRGPKASLRALLLYAGPKGLAVHEEALREAEPVALRPRLDPNQAPERAKLVAEWEAGCEALARQAQAGRLADLESGITRGGAGMDVDILDELRVRLEGYAALFSDEAPDPDEDWDEYDDWDGQGQLPARTEAAPARRSSPQGLQVDKARPEELLDEVARVRLLGRALNRLAEPGAHGVRVEVRAVGSEGRGHLVQDILRTLAGLPEVRVLSAATRGWDGAVWAGGALPEDERALDYAVVELMGPLVADTVAFEEGTHAFHTLAEGTELAVVRALPEDGPAPRALVEGLAAARSAFEARLQVEGGAAGGANPEPLLPLVRRVRVFGSDDPAQAPLYQVEDYRLGLVYSHRAEAMQGALQPLHRMVVSREEGEA